MIKQDHHGNPEHTPPYKGDAPMTPEQRTALINDIASKVLACMLANPHIASTATKDEVTTIVTTACQHLKTDNATNTANIVAEVKKGKE
jgi:hypothetical protein